MPDTLRRITRSVGLALNGNRLVRAGKNARNAIVDRAFRRAAASTGRGFADELVRDGVHDVAFTIAFNTPWLIDLLTAQWSRHRPGLELVVVDNSTEDSARAAHENLCHERNVRYLPLPWNPEWSPNRSHGIAVNWIWFNVVLHAELDIAGFVDHDCIPVADQDLRKRLEPFDAYGWRGASLTHPQAWNLWAGYCFLKPSAAVGMPVDFKHRIEFGLDTGGGNWDGFYRRLDPSRVGEARYQRERINLVDDVPPAEFILLDESFLHLDGGSYRGQFADEAYRTRLVEAIRRGQPGRRRDNRP